MGKFPFKRPRIISKKFPELDSSIEGVTKSLNDLVFSYHAQVQNALSKKHWLMAFSSIALLLVLGSFISQHGKADSSVFYPETCLGGWINPQHAQGEQQTTSNGDEVQFTKENSAVLPKNTNAEIYCGNFKGKFDTTTKPTKIIVALALTKGPELTHEDLIETGQKLATTSVTLPLPPSLPEIASSTTASDDPLFASSSESGTAIDVRLSRESSDSEISTTTIGTATAIPGSQNSADSSVLHGVIESLKDTVRDIFNTNVDTKTQTDTIVIPPVTLPVVAPTEQVPSAPIPEPAADTPLLPTSYIPSQHHFVNYFVGTVFAEEVTTLGTTTETKVIQTASAVPLKENIEKATSTSPESEAVFNGATSTLIASTTTSDIASTTIISSTSISSDIVAGMSVEKTIATTTDREQAQNNFLEVFYTFDGETWKSLGALNEISMKYRTFEIPVTATTSWSKLQQLQIKVVAKKLEVETPTVYLDGITINALFETSVPRDHPDFSRDTILRDKNDGTIRIINIINSDTNENEIFYTTINEQSGYGVEPGSWVIIKPDQPEYPYTLIDIYGDNVFLVDDAQKMLWVKNLKKETNDGVNLVEDGTTTAQFIKSNGEEWYFDYNYETKNASVRMVQ